jgi:hypothetical protein
MLVALLALLAALSGVAVAGTGDNFILGRANTAGKQTSLTGQTANPMLRVENTSTDGNARGVVGIVSAPSAAAGSAGVAGTTASTDPGSVGVLAKNTGGGPALMAAVNPGVPPLAVSSSAKVANLNADQLDGLSSSQFVRGGGSISSIHAVFNAPSGGGNTDQVLGNINGLDIHGVCWSGGPDGAQITLFNPSSSGRAVGLLREGSQGPTTFSILPQGFADTDMPITGALHYKIHGDMGSPQAFTIDGWVAAGGGTCLFDITVSTG